MGHGPRMARCFTRDGGLAGGRVEDRDLGKPLGSGAQHFVEVTVQTPDQKIDNTKKRRNNQGSDGRQA
jgi:hypothetical protein